MAALTLGLIATKTAIVLAAGPSVGLSRAESLRTGLLLGQVTHFPFLPLLPPPLRLQRVRPMFTLSASAVWIPVALSDPHPA